MIVEKNCWERGCACYDARFDEGVLVGKKLAISADDVKHLWETIYDHGHGKYRGEASVAQRTRAYDIIERLRNGVVHEI